MIAFMKQLLVHWQTLPDQRQKLQYAYLTAAVLIIGLAGLIGFFRPDIGQVLAGAGLLLVLTYLLNGVAWGLLRAFIEPYAKQLAKTAKTSAAKAKK